jgi:hypothetical protein
MRAKQRLGFLFYPLATEEEPGCPACGQPMDIAVLEVRSNRPSFASFRCQACNRSDRFLIVPFCGPRPKPKSKMKKSWYVVSYESGLSTAGGRYRRQTRSFLSEQEAKSFARTLVDREVMGLTAGTINPVLRKRLLATEHEVSGWLALP